jgi:proteasome assembly chaperone (PAC2) family protein
LAIDALETQRYDVAGEKLKYIIITAVNIVTTLGGCPTGKMGFDSRIPGSEALIKGLPDDKTTLI